MSPKKIDRRIPTLTDCARALWDRGRTSGLSFDELTEHQRADIIADSAAILKSVLGVSRAADHYIEAILTPQKLDAPPKALKINRRTHID